MGKTERSGENLEVMEAIHYTTHLERSQGEPLTQVEEAFVAWRVFRVGNREVTDAIVAPEHRGPSPVLAGLLRGWKGAYYWPDTDRAHLVLVRGIGGQRRERWLLHVALLVLTLFCALGAGAALQGRLVVPEGYGLADSALAALRFFPALLHGGWRDILSGWSFALPLLAILLVHELGHYFAAHRYAIDASPPYFLPVPPSLSPIGSLGAFIRLRSPVLDRRQLTDVGAAGPLAGFVIALAVLAWGYSTSVGLPAGQGLSGSFVRVANFPFTLGDSVLTQLFREHFFSGAAAVHLSLPAFAGWVGAFVTGLNLLPLSQLDGGHVLYGLMGRRQAAVGFLALVGLLILAQFSWSWYIWAGFVLLVGRGRWTHPSVVSPERPVPTGRRILGWLCVLVFVLTFVPVPFRA